MKKGTHVCWTTLLAFFPNNAGLPIFQNFRHDFFTRFSTNLTHVSGFFLGGGSKWDPCLQMFLCKIHPLSLGGTSPYYSLHNVKLLPPRLFERASNNSAILSIYGMHRYENFATKLWESVGKGHLYEKVISAGTLEWRGTLRVPPQPECPRVCPPWARALSP